ncbi:peptidoglycan-binding protein [Streptomyces sp. T-3]|nr:peptidoglycan-binding protein [Streptomyces sp. T-3]
MSRWKELPAPLEERQQQLVVQLRRLKDHSGLSLASLAAKTAYSRSSWERYLNGKLPVPRDAVGELARVCGAEPTRLLVLHEVAEEARGRGDSEPAEVQGQLEPEAPRTRRMVPLRHVLAGAGLAVAAAFAGGLLLGQLGQEDEGRGVYSYDEGRTYDCADERRDGGRYAGYSLSRGVLLSRGLSGWDVVEVQCLLDRQGFGAGPVDGAYGDATERAVTRFQRARDLAPDGIVGPDTWKELRR